jgi:hypothetical protein
VILKRRSLQCAINAMKKDFDAIEKFADSVLIFTGQTKTVAHSFFSCGLFRGVESVSRFLKAVLG